MVRRTSGIRELIIFFLQIFDVIFYLHFNYSISFLLAFSGLFRNSNDNNVYNTIIILPIKPMLAKTKTAALIL